MQLDSKRTMTPDPKPLACAGGGGGSNGNGGSGGWYKLIYSATFSGPRGPINPLGLKVPGIFPVEVKPHRADKWIVRNPETRKEYSLTCFVSPVSAQNFVAECFEKQETPWTIIDPNPQIDDSGFAVPKPLQEPAK